MDRRQLSVMFCDLVGSTRLSTRLDAEDLREVIHGFQTHATALVEFFGGFVARYMGDGLLVYFGYPRAQEDDAIRAVRAGLELIARLGELSVAGVDATLLKDLSVRVGIATGPVIVGDLIGQGAAAEHSVVGETPNLAARIQAVAQPGSLAIAPGTYELTRSHFEFESLGAHALKGLEQPVQLWRPTTERRPERAGDLAAVTTEQPMIGREQELGLLLDRYRTTGQSNGQVVLICAEAGMGKSRLVADVMERLEPKPATCVRVQAALHQQNRILGPFFDAVAGRAIESADAEPDADSMLAELGPMALDKRHVVDEYVGQSSTTGITMSPDRYRDDAIGLLEDYLEGLTKQGSVVLLVEDAQWLDSASLSLLERVGGRVEALPLFVLITARPGFTLDTSKVSRLIQLSLNRLNRDQCRSVAECLAGGRTIPDDVASTIAERSDGVPLFVEEITRAVLNSAAIQTTEKSVELLRPLPEGDIPATLQDSLMARLDRLGQAKQVAQWAAAFGRSVSREQLLGVMGVVEAELDPWLSQLVEAGVMIRQGGGTYSFRHTLVRDTAYGSLLRKRRRQMHEEIVRFLVQTDPALADAEPELLAIHHAGAGHAIEAAELWSVAGKRAERQGMLVEAARHFEHSLDACRLCTDEDRHRREVEAWINLGWLVRQLGQLERTESAFAEAERLANEHGVREPLARLYVGRGNLYFLKGDTQACEAAHRRALEFAKETGNRVDEARALGGLGDALHARHRYRSAADYLARCVALSREIADNEVLIPNNALAGWVQVLFGEPERGKQTAEETLRLIEKYGNRRAELISHGVISMADAVLGNPQEALVNMRASRALAERMGTTQFLLFNSYLQYCLERLQGDETGAAATLAAGRELRHNFPTRGHFLESTTVRDIVDRDERRRTADSYIERIIAGPRGAEDLFTITEIGAALAIHRDWEHIRVVGERLAQHIDPVECPWIENHQLRMQALHRLATDPSQAGELLRQAEADERRFLALVSIRQLAETIADQPWEQLVAA